MARKLDAFKHLFTQMSDKKLAEAAGVTVPTVKKYRRELEAAAAEAADSGDESADDEDDADPDTAPNAESTASAAPTSESAAADTDTDTDTEKPPGPYDHLEVRPVAGDFVEVEVSEDEVYRLSGLAFVRLRKELDREPTAADVVEHGSLVGEEDEGPTHEEVEELIEAAESDAPVSFRLTQSVEHKHSNKVRTKIPKSIYRGRMAKRIWGLLSPEQRAMYTDMHQFEL